MEIVGLGKLFNLQGLEFWEFLLKLVFQKTNCSQGT